MQQTNLLRNQHHYKGYNIVNLRNNEILCPVCTRLVNALCPQPIRQSRNYTPGACLLSVAIEGQHVMKGDNDTWLTVMEWMVAHVNKNATVTELDSNDQYSIKNTLDSFYNKIASLTFNLPINKLDQDDELHCDPILLASSVAYNISTLEVEQRADEDDFDSSNDMKLSAVTSSVIRNLIECCMAYMTRSRDAITTCQEHLSGILESMSGMTKNVFNTPWQQEVDEMHQDEFDDLEDLIYHAMVPWLSCDMFAMLVKILIMMPQMFRSDLYSKLMRVAYETSILQCLLIMKHGYACDVNGEGGDLLFGDAIDSVNGMMKNVSDALEIPTDRPFEKLDACDWMGHVKQMLLPFLRRCCLFTGICYDASTFPHHEDSFDFESQFDDLICYLKLPTLPQVSESWKNDSNVVVNKLLNQLDHCVNQTSRCKWPESCKKIQKQFVIQSIMPRISREILPFRFVALDRQFQQLFLKFHKASCAHCGLGASKTVLCLICGQYLFLKQCDKCKKQSDVGMCTQHARSNYCGVGF
ncbi:1 TM domain-containing transmembrane protein [Acrasis kona]|uniref:E3 ubiquitin-protein ligase n=1 Tax=Acrasis kona TaxID=1008807 RepID=A0AAW2ZBQ8_9EUKA